MSEVDIIFAKIVEYNVAEANRLSKLIEIEAYERGVFDGYQEGLKAGRAETLSKIHIALGLVHCEAED
jgi:hypothetical protein